MIRDRDRSGWIGASDTRFVTGNWGTKTFDRWWAEKLGLVRGGFQNRYTLAGRHWEHGVLDALGIPLRKDAQIKIRRLRLRVNLDGDTAGTVYEVKTHRADRPFRLSRAYWEQVQVQMFAKGCAYAYVVHYGLLEEDYENYFRPIDNGRLGMVLVEYDRGFVEGSYLPRLRVLAECLKEKRWPGGAEI